MLAGVVITKEPVINYVPLYVRDNVISTQFIMTTLEELGLLKMDFLGLRTLTVISDAIKLVKYNQGLDVEFDQDMNDSEVYKLWAEGKTCGIFQFESQGMTNFMKELKPDSLEDIIAGVSLYRPGPMDQIPRYIKNKLNPEHAEYTHPSLEPILKVTYGSPSLSKLHVPFILPVIVPSAFNVMSLSIVTFTLDKSLEYVVLFAWFTNP